MGRSSSIGRFAWRTDEGERSYRLEKFVEVARAMMGRRGLTPGKAYLEQLGTLARRL